MYKNKTKISVKEILPQYLQVVMAVATKVDGIIPPLGIITKVGGVIRVDMAVVIREVGDGITRTLETMDNKIMGADQQETNNTQTIGPHHTMLTRGEVMEVETMVVDKEDDFKV